MENNEKVCVKFTHQYSMEAHSFYSSIGFALVLKGFKCIADRWYMIVIDAITDKFGHIDKPSASLHKPIKEKVVALYQQGYVYSDLHDINLMVREDGAPKMMLFAINMNRGPNLKQPDGAYDGELITAEHNMEMLDIMFKVAFSNT
jgi:hypothetical protein